MSTDELFRWIFVAILVGFLPFGLYHRIRSNIGGEKLDRWQEGTFILFGLRLSGLPWFIGGIVWMIDPKLMALGISSASALAALVRIHSDRSLGRSLRVDLPDAWQESHGHGGHKDRNIRW